jgi:hypothetical protein
MYKGQSNPHEVMKLVKRTGMTKQQMNCKTQDEAYATMNKVTLSFSHNSAAIGGPHI